MHQEVAPYAEAKRVNITCVSVYNAITHTYTQTHTLILNTRELNICGQRTQRLCDLY